MSGKRRLCGSVWFTALAADILCTADTITAAGNAPEVTTPDALMVTAWWNTLGNAMTGKGLSNGSRGILKIGVGVLKKNWTSMEE